jgi:hypothetical protein
MRLIQSSTLRLILSGAFLFSCSEFYISDDCLPGDLNCSLLALSSFANCTYNSPPRLLDSFQYNGASTQSEDIFSFDRTVLTLLSPTATSRWIVRASFDAGASWQITDDYTYPGGMGAKGKGLFRGPDGAVYATGFGVDSGGVNRWIVRRSGDGGRTWDTVDDFGNGVAGHAPGQGAGATRNGFRVAGSIDTPPAFVIRSSVDGFSWQTLLQESLAAEPQPNEMRESPDGALFVPGARTPVATDIDTIVKSVDNGASWSIKDQYLPAGHLSASSTSILAEASLQFATGFSKPTGVEFRGNVRRSQDGGETWQLLREFQNGAVNIAYGIHRAPNLARDLFIPGTEGSQFFVSHRAVLYRSSDDGLTWRKFVDESVLGAPASINGFMDLAPGGAFYILSVAIDGGGSNTHAVRLLPCY